MTALPLDKLKDYLKSQIGTSLEISSTKEFSGGASNPTYLLRCNHGDFVLRSKPVGKLVSKAHAIDREYRVMNALGKTDFPVPKTITYCDNMDVIGAEFYIMEYIEGKVFEDFTLPGLTQSERAAIYDSMNETMAKLHNIDPDDIGLSDYGRTGNYFERQINLWMRQYQNQDQSIPRFERLSNWLSANIITDDRRTIVHGDYRLSNIIISADTPKVAAVLDWELSTLGHPLADFAYNLSQWYLPNFDVGFNLVNLVGADLNALGIPSMKAYAKTYAKRTGVEISDKELYYSIAFNMYRLSGIIIGIIGRSKSGTAKNEASSSAANNLLDPTIDLALEYADKANRC